MHKNVTIIGMLLFAAIFIILWLDVSLPFFDPWNFTTECSERGGRCIFIIDTPTESKTVKFGRSQRSCFRRISTAIPMSLQLLDANSGKWSNPIEIPPGPQADIKLPMASSKYWRFSAPKMKQNDGPLVIYSRIVSEGTKCTIDRSRD